MKKKIFYMFLPIIFASSVFANDSIDIEEIVNTTSMPTDSEIMKTIDKFATTKEEKEYLFKETKKQLEILYSKDNSKPSKLKKERK